MPEPVTDEDKIAEMAKRTERMADDKAWIYKTIPEVFPEKHGGEAVRGRLTAVVKATGLTREYVARIRDGKVKPT
jgi:hypothetical protein